MLQRHGPIMAAGPDPYRLVRLRVWLLIHVCSLGRSRSRACGVGQARSMCDCRCVSGPVFARSLSAVMVTSATGEGRRCVE